MELALQKTSLSFEEAIERARELILSHDYLIDFTRATKPNYQVSHFSESVCEALDQFLQDVIEKKSPRLILMAPPRHGKSELVSRRFPAYALGRYPDLQFIATSYADSLASEFNRDVQRIIDDEAYQRIFPDTKLFGSNVRTKALTGSWLRNNDTFEIVGHKGAYRSAGVGSGITGKGADILLIDDPIKDAEQAYSTAYRQRLWEWYTTTAYTRLEPGGGVIIMLTRWHVDDLVGRIKENFGERWQEICYSAIAEADEAGRKMGEPLVTSRYDLTALEEIKRVIGPKAWASLYQQRPTVEGGSIFAEKDFVDYEQEPIYEHLVRYWDRAASPDGDYTCGVLMGVWRGEYYVIDVDRFRAGPAQVKARIGGVAEKDGRGVTVAIEQDPGQAGKFEISEYLDYLDGYDVLAIPASASKITRARPFASQVGIGKVHVLNAPWAAEYKQELSEFPYGKYDDQVDASSGAYTVLQSRIVEAVGMGGGDKASWLK